MSTFLRTIILVVFTLFITIVTASITFGSNSNCVATFDDSGTLYIPCVNLDEMYWVEMKYYDDFDDHLLFKVTGIGKSNYQDNTSSPDSLKQFDNGYFTIEECTYPPDIGDYEFRISKDKIVMDGDIYGSYLYEKTGRSTALFNVYSENDGVETHQLNFDSNNRGSFISIHNEGTVSKGTFVFE